MFNYLINPEPSMNTGERDRRRWLWLAIGAAMSLLTVGGRWDVPLVAWLVVVLLLRVIRTSRLLAGLGLVWLVSVGAAVFWMWQMAVPLTGLTGLGGLAFGSVLALPYVADRLLVQRLGTAGEVLLFPMALAGCEFLLGTFSPFGTAYGLLANTQGGNPALVQVSSVVGPYGIGFLIGAFATVVNWAWAHPLARRTARTVGAYTVVVAVVAFAGAARLASGASRASRWATRPPRSWPATPNRSKPSASMTSNWSRAIARFEYSASPSVGTGLSLSPYPRRSASTTVWLAASRGAI
jgi:apolipoprotein N-acyltransferase